MLDGEFDLISSLVSRQMRRTNASLHCATRYATMLEDKARFAGASPEIAAEQEYAAKFIDRLESDKRTLTRLSDFLFDHSVEVSTVDALSNMAADLSIDE